MGYIVRMPKLGMEMQEGELLEWKVAVGDAVETDEVIAEIESEKSVADVEAREDGVLRERVLEPGEVVEPGEPLGIVAGPDEDVSDLRAEAGVEDPAESEAEGSGARPSAVEDSTGDDAESSESGRVRASPRARRLADERGVDLADVGGSGPGGAVVAADVETAAGGNGDSPDKVSPRARKLADERGVDLAGLEGSGPEGAVIAADVEAAAEAGAGTEAGSASVDAGAGSGGGAAADTARAEGAGGAATEGTASGKWGERTVRERREFGGMRRTIAERLGESYRNAVHVTVDREVDVEALLHATEVADDALEADVSMPDLLLVALSEALAAHPEFNATYEDGIHTVYEDQHVGIAVDVDEGLVTPVLRGLEDRSLAEVAGERERLIDLAVDGEYTTDDLSGGTFTVSNLGVLGVDSFTPVINPPEVAILGINRVREVPRPADDGDGVEFRRRLTVSLSFDHRVVDGADAARFLDAFASAVESPWSALLDRT